MAKQGSMTETLQTGLIFKLPKFYYYRNFNFDFRNRPTCGKLLQYNRRLCFIASSRCRWQCTGFDQQLRRTHNGRMRWLWGWRNWNWNTWLYPSNYNRADSAAYDGNSAHSSFYPKANNGWPGFVHPWRDRFDCSTRMYARYFVCVCHRYSGMIVGLLCDISCIYF